jgi:outer membrane cobalamin receptor
MSLWRLFLVVLFFLGISRAAELRVRVVDPQNAAVAGAEVVVLRGDQATAGIGRTSAQGEVVFRIADGSYRVRVLAPSFAASEGSLAVSGDTQQTIQLKLAPTVETVNVTANGVAVAGEDSSAPVETLSHDELQAMQPVMASDALRFLPGAIVNTVGRRGGQASLFVRGGESRYNKVILDGVPVNDPGGTFDFGVLPVEDVERVEVSRGAQSTLYGSDAMTSVVQIFTARGHTRVPEVQLAADGGTFATARGNASVSGANGPFDYHFFGAQSFTDGQGANDVYSDTAQGANLGVQLGHGISLRMGARHTNNFSGVAGEWNFNGQPLLPPDRDGHVRFNSVLADADLGISQGAHWRHDLRGFEYHLRRVNQDPGNEPGRVDAFGFNIDFPTDAVTDANRAGFAYQGEYWAQSWSRSTFGYEFEKENAFTGDRQFGLTFGQRLNHAVFGQEMLSFHRLSLLAGLRFVHNEFFGNKAVPRVAAGVTVRQGGDRVGATRLHGSFASGIKAPRFEETFANGFGIVPNPNLRAEENRAFEAGIEQSLWGGRSALTLNYFRNQFRNRVDFVVLDPITFTGEYVNINRAYAQGAELGWHTQLTPRLSADAGYTYLASRIVETAPLVFDPVFAAGQPLLRRPKHSASLLLNYAGQRWGGDLATSFVGPRLDSDFFGYGFNHAAGYARVDLGGWYNVTRRITAYVKVENALNKHYEEVTGYPALRANFRAGLRFRIGGE